MKSPVKDYATTPAADKRSAVHDTEFGTRILEEIKRLLGAQRYNLWFSQDTSCCRQDNKTVFHIRNAFAAQTVRAHCQAEIDQAVSNVSGEKLETVFRIEGRKTIKKTEQQKAEPAKPDRQNEGQQISASRTNAAAVTRSMFPQFKNLDTFLKGLSNDMACRAVELVLYHPCEINPVYIHGFSGTGKTHLLEGIWGHIKQGGRAQSGSNTALSNNVLPNEGDNESLSSLKDSFRLSLPVNSRTAPLYLTSEQFVSSFLESIRSSNKCNEKFRSRFENLSVLLIDDIQFLSGKEATQTEFLHILDESIRRGVQVILTGDKPLHQLHLRSDVISRLEAGLSCSIDLPERDLSLRICRQIVAERKLPIGDDVCRMTADRYGTSVRLLQGALNRLHAASLTEEGKNLTLPFAEKVLADFPALTRVQIVTLKDVEAAVCEAFNIGKERLQSKSRTKAVTVPRMLAMYLARKYTRSALSEIGDFFGRMSHSSVISAQKKVDKWIAEDDKIIPALRRMERKLS
ncbi:MAG: AAA family ATPase [Planctomycetaceae bacterium]|jgi:chromosomal replication initiator protein|nr:AAA family ATPase [Planctomycetaceae bacterium]